MKIAIHQPHYFPWLGYMDKMAKADRFVILDEAQLTERSNMFRNKFLSNNGVEKTLGVTYEKRNHLELPFRSIKINKNIKWQTQHSNFIKVNYGKTLYFNEIWNEIKEIFEDNFDYVYDVDLRSILKIKSLLAINTDFVFQSDIQYNREVKKNDMVLEICKSMQADQYLSGNGARTYMNIEVFEQNGIAVAFQEFLYPVYNQIGTKEFVPNLSCLDLLFNCGIEKSRAIFWENVKKSKEFSE